MILRALLLLARCKQYDARLWEKFEETGAEPAALIEGGPTFWEKLGISERCRGVMAKSLREGWPERELEACASRGVRLVTCCDAVYPQALRDLPDAPLLFYLRGEALSLPAESVGVVGTRRCSSYAAGVAREIGRMAAGAGWGLVSGGAKGVDGAAHGGCLEGDGITFAVLGTGVDVVYPSEHRELFERIASRGALVSEYPLGTKGEAWHFPKRNRIIAGLSGRTVVAEAPIKSGAMITARQAAEIGRDVWAVPGRIGEERSAGSNRLIFDGAQPLIDMETFFGTYRASGPGRGQTTLFGDEPEPAREEVRLNESEKMLVALLTNRGDRTIDNLASEVKMSAAEVFKTMSLLSIRGVVFSSGPGRYRLTD